MATKNDKKQAKGLMETLERRVCCGPPVLPDEIETLRSFLCQHEFSPASDYFSRLLHLEHCLAGRAKEALQPQVKQNYGGTAGEYRMQVQSIYDHLILSTCYAGAFNGKMGRVKISHRINQAGRIDFVELKYLRSLHPPLNGAVRKLVVIKDYQSIRKDWYEAEAIVLKVLPQELIFLYANIFRSPKAELFAWLLNIGHGIVNDLLKDLNSRPRAYFLPPDHAWESVGLGRDRQADFGPAVAPEPDHCSSVAWNRGAVGSILNHSARESVYTEQNYTGHSEPINGNGNENRFEGPTPAVARCVPEQLNLYALREDKVALPILEKAAALKSVVEVAGPTDIVVRYLRTYEYFR